MELALALVLLASPSFATAQESPADDDAPSTQVAVPSGEALAETVARGAAILLEMQESLSGDDARREWPYEGVYRVARGIPWGYRVGGTSIGAWALIETPGSASDEEITAAVGRALDFVLEGLDEPLMDVGFDGSYDVRGWGHAYALQFLVRLRALDRVPEERAEEVDARIVWLIEALEETEIVERGGWNYARRGGGDAPAGASPFMTLSTVLALMRADAAGEDVDPAVVARALDALEACRIDSGAFTYTTDGGMEAVPGAIGRMPGAEMVLLLTGRGSVDRVRTALDAFFEHWEWLEQRRRQTGTHVRPYMIAPYYFFYAHYYAAAAIEFLPEEERPAYRTRFLERLFQVQEDSGGWNDRVFPRSENYGTAMSVLAILQPDLPRPPEWSEPERESPR